MQSDIQQQLSDISSDISDSSTEESSGSNSDCDKQNLTRKRDAKATSIDGSPAKKVCNENDFDSASKLMKKSISTALQILKKRNDVQIDLQKELKQCQASNDALRVQKNVLQRIVAKTEEANHNQMETFDQEKKKMLEQFDE